MTENDFLEQIKQIGDLNSLFGEYVFSISNDVETIEFYTGKKTLTEACKELVDIANTYNIEETVFENVKESRLPESYINIAYLRKQTAIIKGKLLELKEIIITFLD